MNHKKGQNFIFSITPFVGSRTSPENGSKWPVIRLLGTSCTFPCHKSKKLVHFLVVLIYGDFWENMSLLMYFLGSIKGFWVGQRVRKLVKMTLYTTFRNIWYTFTPYKLKINTFSGSTNFWGLLGEYKPLNVLPW